MTVGNSRASGQYVQSGGQSLDFGFFLSPRVNHHQMKVFHCHRKHKIFFVDRLLWRAFPMIFHQSSDPIATIYSRQDLLSTRLMAHNGV